MTFASETIVKSTRKDHRCAFCGTTIPAGSEMLRMCLCVNLMFGNEQAKKLLNLVVAARREVAGEDKR